MKCIIWLLFLCIPFTTKAYWQQYVKTSIQVSLDDQNHILRGFEKLEYTNNSPDTLRYLYIHLWPNAYKNDRTQFSEQQIEKGKTDFYYSAEQDKGFIDSLSFEINGESVEFYYAQDNLDIAKIELVHPLVPGESIIIETPFRVKIPTVFSRLGHNGQAYFISQWFPKPAVYDRLGWHPLAYLDQGEFYSEIGGYDVSITLPKNYIVMATGNCQNHSEQEWLENLGRQSLPSDTLFKSSFPKSDVAQKTLRFTEENVHDFAWFADKRWVVRIDSFKYREQENPIYTYAAFLPQHQKEWLKANDILKSTLKIYGNEVGEYPYKTIKAVEGDMIAGGGMEYPTVTIIDKSVYSDLQEVITHEAGHNWFYGMLASNEREHPWMDEGMNSFYEQKTNQYLNDTLYAKYKNKLEDFLYFQLAASGQDQALSFDATQYPNINYGADVYFKSVLLLRWLEAYMGKDDFKKGMQAYFEYWKFKHPYPDDFRNSMQSQTTKSLDWFFNSALNTDRKIDFKLQNVNLQKDSISVVIKNKSDIAAPIAVQFFQKDSLVNTIWTPPFQKELKISCDNNLSWDKIKLGATFVDIKSANDEYRRRGLVRKGGLRMGMGFGLNRSAQNKVYLLPSLGYNVYDGIGLGLLFHNLSYPENRFQFLLSPQYSFGSKTINGIGAISYSWYPKQLFSEIRLQTDLKSYTQYQSNLNIDYSLYARYYKIAPSLELIFKQRDLRSKLSNRITIKEYNINEQRFVYTRNFVLDSLYRPSLQSIQNTYVRIKYQHANNRTFHPYSYDADLQLGQNFIKLGLDARMKINYDIKNKSFYIRAYAGKFISTSASADNSRYWLNTCYSGVNDYFFDANYLGRNEQEGLASQQISMQEGGFKMPTNFYANPLGRSDNWLLALNLKTDLPLGKLPLRFYADIATFADAKLLNPSGNAFLFNAGLELSLFRKTLVITAPLIVSKDYSEYLKGIFPKDKFLKSITFSFNIRDFNLLRTHEYLFKELAK